MLDQAVLPITDQVPFRAFQVRGYEAAILFATDKNGEEFFTIRQLIAIYGTVKQDLCCLSLPAITHLGPIFKIYSVPSLTYLIRTI